MEYRNGSSTKYRILINYVFCPKYRRRVLRGEIASRLEELFKQACEVNNWAIEELSIQVDHVHLLIQIDSVSGISRVAQLLKGGSSRVIRKEFPKLEEFLWGDSFWSDGYFAESIGVKNESLMREYIKNQNKS